MYTWLGGNIESVESLLQMVTKTKILLTIFRNCLFAAKEDCLGGRVPSSGLVSIYALKDLCKHTTAFGFGAHPNAAYQYYQHHGTQRVFGNPTHSFAAEAALLQTLAKEKVLSVCGPAGCTGASRVKTIMKSGKTTSRNTTASSLAIPLHR
jgi:hypothetical protein